MNSNSDNLPPRLPLRFFRWFCHPDLLPYIEGDLIELFEERVREKGVRRAKWLFAWDVLKLFRPGIIKKFEGQTQITNYGMFNNYLKVAFRILKKEKGFAFVNIFGLALAITCSLFIYLWVQDELQYNSFLTSGDRINYVMHNEVMTNGEINTYHSSPYNLKKVLEDKYPFIEQVAIMSYGNWLAFKKGENLMEIEGNDSSPEVFDMFEIPFLQGDHKTIAISESFANKYFGEDWRTSNVLGQNLVTERGESYELVGIFADLPKQSTLRFEFVIPHEIRLSNNEWLKRWGNNGSRMYVKLTDHISFEEANLKIKTAIINNRDDGEISIREIFLQPFKGRYLYNRVENGKISGGRIEYVRLLSVAAIMILLLASINFMNLATARSAKRAKETGVRKVLGAFRSNLKAQFLTESLLITAFALVASLALVFLLLPQFNEVTGKDVTIAFFTPGFIASLFVFVLLLGLFSGAYPAFYLSALSTISSLKGGHKHNRSDVVFRKGLVIFQFMITIIMITGAITVYRQVGYIQTKNIGLDRSNLIRNWAHEFNSSKDYQIFKSELLKRPGIEGFTTTNQNLIDIGNSTSDPEWNGKLKDELAEFYILSGNPDFIPTTGIKLKEGRNFDWGIQTDTANYIINEAAQKLMRMENAVGEDLEFWDVKGKIIGVMEDFHNASLHRAIEPMILRYDLQNNAMILTRTKPGQTEEALASLEEVYHLYNPKREFHYEFMDDIYNQQYQSELMVKDLSLYFTILAIVISCLGLFALVSYTAEQRTKEIGIRKVLGATIMNILQLLSREFVWLLAISMLVAVPLAYFVMSGWLNGFAYRIDLSWWLFAIAGIVTIVISYSIIGSHAIKSALANPVDSLRDE